MPEITDGLKYLIIPVCFVFAVKSFKNRPTDILKIIFWLSIFIIWVNVPYLLGLIEPKVLEDYSYSFGEDMIDNAGFSGANMNIHTQAVYLGSALLFIIYLIVKFPKEFKSKNVFLISTIFIGLYALYLSFARTGWAFFVLGLFIILFLNFDFRQLKRMLGYVTLTVVGLITLYNSSSSFRKRLVDDRQYAVEDEKINQVGSGRLLYAVVAIENWYQEDNILTLLKGYGTEYGKEKMYESIGNRIFAHNAYIEILQRSGVVGLTLFLLYIFLLYRFIKTLTGPFLILLKAYFIGWLLVGAVQEFTFVYLNLIMAGVLAFCYIYTMHYSDKQHVKP